MPTSVPPGRPGSARASMGPTKGCRVWSTPIQLVSITAAKAGRSPASRRSVPTEMPALAITTSGTPATAMNAEAASCIDRASRTSAA